MTPDISLSTKLIDNRTETIRMLGSKYNVAVLPYLKEIKAQMDSTGQNALIAALDIVQKEDNHIRKMLFFSAATEIILGAKPIKQQK